MKDRTLSSIILVFGLVWLKSSWGKLSGGSFVKGLGDTLGKFASKNPNTWFKSTLETIAIPNSLVIGNLVMYGEFFVAVVLTGLSLYLLIKREISPMLGWLLCLGLAGGAILNLLFWLAAGWMSPSTDSLNLLMLLVQGIILVSMVRRLASK